MVCLKRARVSQLRLHDSRSATEAARRSVAFTQDAAVLIHHDDSQSPSVLQSQHQGHIDPGFEIHRRVRADPSFDTKQPGNRKTRSRYSLKAADLIANVVERAFLVSQFTCPGEFFDKLHHAGF